MTTYSSDDVQYNDPKSPAYLKTLSQILNGEEVSLQRFINPTQFAAIQNGTTTYNAFTDLSSAFNSSARSLYAPPGIFRFSGDLPAIPIGAVLRGSGCGEYTTQGNSTQGLTIFERQDAGTTGSAVLTLGDGATVELLQVRPANWQAVDYAAATYPAGTGNVGIGIKMADQTAQARHVNATAFPVAAFQLGTTSVLERCYAYMSNKGYALQPGGATDGCLLNCVAMFNQNAGAELIDNFWQVIGGRFEWNARFGLVMGAESTCVGATFDRNGMAGLCIQQGMWGKTITGNYFARNGCGGNGINGRWGFSVPGHNSYVAVPSGQSCHIQVDYEHAVTISGNRFRNGSGDSNDGCDGPKFVYGSTTPNGASPNNGVITVGNVGDRKTHAVLGYNVNYAGVANSGKPAGGTDTSLITYLNGLT